MIVDVNTYLGHWPFRRIRHSGISGLLSLMERAGTDLAITTPLNSVFYKLCVEGLREATEEIGERRGQFYPLAVINPSFPGWEEDFFTSIDESGAVGLRLFPNYHGYSITDKSARTLLSLATQKALPTTLTFRIQDERSHHWLMKVPPVPVQDVQMILKDFPDSTFILSNILWNEVEELEGEILERTNIFIEISYFKGPMFLIERLAERFGSNKILYGSAAPLQYPEAALFRITKAGISEEDKARILGENAMKIYNLT